MSTAPARRWTPSACGTCAPFRSGRSRGSRGSSCARLPVLADQADEDVLQRTLAGVQVLEVDAVLREAAQQRGDAGFLRLHVEGIDQRMAVFGQLQRVVGKIVGN